MRSFNLQPDFPLAAAVNPSLSSFLATVRSSTLVYPLERKQPPEQLEAKLQKRYVLLQHKTNARLELCLSVPRPRRAVSSTLKMGDQPFIPSLTAPFTAPNASWKHNGYPSEQHIQQQGRKTLQRRLTQHTHTQEEGGRNEILHTYTIDNLQMLRDTQVGWAVPNSSFDKPDVCVVSCSNPRVPNCLQMSLGDRDKWT